MATKQVSITIPEVQSLADRLLSRGVSRLGPDLPEQRHDMRLAAAWLRALARSFNGRDKVDIDVANGEA